MRNRLKTGMPSIWARHSWWRVNKDDSIHEIKSLSDSTIAEHQTVMVHVKFLTDVVEPPSRRGSHARIPCLLNLKLFLAGFRSREFLRTDVPQTHSSGVNRGLLIGRLLASSRLLGQDSTVASEKYFRDIIDRGVWYSRREWSEQSTKNRFSNEIESKTEAFHCVMCGGRYETLWESLQVDRVAQ